MDRLLSMEKTVFMVVVPWHSAECTDKLRTFLGPAYFENLVHELKTAKTLGNSENDKK